MQAGVRCRVNALLAVLAGLAWAPARAQAPTPTVVVAQPLPRHIVQWDEYTGRFEAVQRVEVRPRVSGFIDSIHFIDGVTVQQGDKLFTIDPRPYEIAAQSAAADVVRTQAEVARSTADVARAAQLVKTNNATVRDFDQRRANAEVARAQLMSAQAALRNAQLNLEWTEVTAPIGGRISDRKVDAGNLVSGTGDATLLTTIVSSDPIYFTFDAAEGDYVHYNRLAKEGKRPSSRDAANPVELQLGDESGWPHHGKMNFVDNEVNAHSGTIRGRAIFDNKDNFFTPGTFARMRLFGGYADVLLVPDSAVESDQAAKIVLTIGPNDSVVAKTVELAGLAFGLRAVTSGLSKDDKIIIGGLANPFVRPGATVQIVDGTIVPAADEGATTPPPATHRSAGGELMDLNLLFGSATNAGEEGRSSFLKKRSGRLLQIQVFVPPRRSATASAKLRPVPPAPVQTYR